MADHFILATAGHVDHGKSALVKALTGIDPDRLPEEKARGITIDLGFAHLELPAPSALNAQPATFHLGIVDVPGHEDFVKNMVAGVGSIDLALFVVAADDGWMPQTEEHLQILTYLGVTRAVVALTKIDLAEGDESGAVAGVREKLQDSPFANAPIVKTSVVQGRGLGDLASTLAQVLAGIPPPRDLGKPRLPVDRVFTLRGIGTVVTGTLTGGVFRRGQAVVIQPEGNTTRIRSLQSHHQEVEQAGPGTRTALNLPDLAIAGHDQEGIKRGDLVTISPLGSPTRTVDVLLEKSSRLAGAETGAARPLKDSALVRWHHGSANFSARVLLAEGGQIESGQSVWAQLRFEHPVFTLAGDRFIVRDWSEQWTLAGGMVLDAEGDRRRFRSTAQQTFLKRCSQSLNEAPAWVDALLARDGVARRSALLVKSHFGAEEISEAVRGLAAEGKARTAGELLAHAAWWSRLRQQAAQAIDAEHQAHPERGGLPLHDLRNALEASLVMPEVFEALLADLGRKDFQQVNAVIRRVTHRPALPPHFQAAGARLRAALSAKPFEPPSRKELAPDAVSQKALRFLLETGEAVEIGGEVVLLAENFTRATEAIKRFLRGHGPATVSELRQAVGASRRIVVPLLEKLDREGVTRREGDKRVLRGKN